MFRVVALAFATVSLGCSIDCPEGTPDDVFVRATGTLELSETTGDPRTIGSYGRPRANGVQIGYLLEHPDLSTDPSARNEWIGHLVFEWPDGDASRELELGAENCRFVVDRDGSHDRVVGGPLADVIALAGYRCGGSATRTSSDGRITITFTAHLNDAAPVGRADGEHETEHREPSCGGIDPD